MHARRSFARTKIFTFDPEIGGLSLPISSDEKFDVEHCPRSHDDKVRLTATREMADNYTTGKIADETSETMHQAGKKRRR